MNESITRAAGAVHGQEMPPKRLKKIIYNVAGTSGARRILRQHTTLYGLHS